MNVVSPIAPIKSVLFRSPDPQKCCVGNPDLCILKSGRFLATLDYASPIPTTGDGYIGKIMLSDDKGESWREIMDFPFMHEIAFEAGNAVYILGHVSHGGLRIIRSDDDGETWSEFTQLTFDNYRWHQSACNVCYVEDRVYLVMEYYPKGLPYWGVGKLAPVLMRANVNDDLTKPESWTFAKSASFEEITDLDSMDWFGVPFYGTHRENYIDVGAGRGCAPVGFLESNVVHIEDPEHIWYDPTGRTFHLLMRAHTGRTNLCCVMQVVEHDDGTMTTEFVKAPSGKTMLYMPMPGGQMKFYVLYDEKTKLYWLLSSQSTDSMIKPECMPANRFTTPDNERHRLQLHFSKNCVDWCFACLVDKGETALQARHYGSMRICGDDLYILSRSGDENSQSAHNTNMITLHEIKNFRELVY